MLPLIFDTCVPRDEILSEDLSLDLFAAKLRLVVEGTAPQVDRDANKSFANTFATDGIKTLITDCGIATLAKNKYLVLTDDFKLANYLQKIEIDTINFNNIRAYG
jgi:hypothetical protein